MLTYTLSVNLSSTFSSEMEIVNELLFVISIPPLLQSRVVGGPPLVTPIRVKVGGSLRNEEEDRDIWLLVMTPNSMIQYLYVRTFVIILHQHYVRICGAGQKGTLVEGNSLSHLLCGRFPQ